MKTKAISQCAVIFLIVFASCSSKPTVVDPVTTEASPTWTLETVKAVDWEKIELPEDYFVELVTIGEAGEIVVIGNDIRISKDDGKTWRIISEGRGYDRCTLDGGKTFDKECETESKKPVKLKIDKEVVYSSVFNAAIMPDGRLYLSTFYEHHGALWSISLNDPKELWFGLHFTYEDDPGDTKYWTTDEYISLKNKIYISAASKTERFWLTTDDKGKTWHRANINMSSDKIAADENNGLRINDGTIEKTTDGGRSWTILVVPTPPENTFSYFFVDDKKGFASGDEGRLSVTEDGGSSWKKIDLGITETLYGVAMFDPVHAWVFGEKGMILETSDGGQNWRFLDFGQARDMTATFYEHSLSVDKNHGAVWLILDGKLYRKVVK